MQWKEQEKSMNREEGDSDVEKEVREVEGQGTDGFQMK